MTNSQTTTTGKADKRFHLAQAGIQSWKPLLIFALIAFAIMLGGDYVFERYKKEIKTATQQELSGIAKLKTEQITNWIAKFRGNAQTIGEDPLFLAEVEHWLQQGGPAGTAKTRLAERLALLQRSEALSGCTAISLFDSKGKLRISTAPQTLSVSGQELLSKSIRTGQTLFSEIHVERRNNAESLEIDFVAPLYSGTNGKEHNIGAILFVIDPQQRLFPLIQTWPTGSPSAESLLVRREGNESVFLNELRHRKHTALSMRLPLSNKKLLSVKASSGWEGMVEGLDYRGIPVVGVINAVPGTTWKMISKVDQEEMYAPINSLSNWVELLMLAFIMVGGGMALFWRKKELAYVHALHKQREQEVRQQALSQRLDYLSKYANDIIILVDDSGKIVEFNDRALETYGYSADEFSNMSIFDLRTTEYTSRISEDFRKIQEVGSLRFESLHIRKNGESFPVEVSVRAVDIDGKMFQQAILRDISERKKAEAELTRQKEFLRQVIDSDPNLIFVKNDHGKILLANKAMAQSVGQTTESIVGKFNWEFHDDLEQIERFDRENRAVIESRQKQVTIDTVNLSGGKQRTFQTIREPLFQDNDNIDTLTIAMDITELKAAEKGLRRLNRSLKLLGACNAAMAHIEDEHGLLMEICKLAVEMGGYHMAWVGFAEPGMDKTVQPVAKYGYDEGYLDSAAVRSTDTDRGCGPTGMAIKTGKTQVNSDSQTNPMMAPWRNAALARCYLSSIALPLGSNGVTIGALTIYAAETDAFNAEEIKLLEELADNLALGISALRAIVLRDRAVEELRQSEELFRYLTENTSDIVFLLTVPNGRFDYLSPAATRLTGYTPEELYHFSVADMIDHLIHADSKSSVAQLWERARTGDVDPYVEYCINHKSGEKRWLGQRNTPIRNMGSDGSLIAIQGVIIDITERKLAQMQYESEHCRLRTLVQTIPDMVWLKDTEGVYLSCNPQLERLFGAKEADIVGKTDYDFANKELADHFRQKDREAMVADQPRVNEEWITYPDNGQRALLETIKVPMRDETGKLIGVMGIARDITERINSATAIRELNADLAATLKAMPDLMFEMGEDGRYINIWAQNPALLAAQKERLLGRTVNEMLPPDAAATIMSALAEAGEKGYSGGQVIKLDLPQGESWFELSTAIKTSDDTKSRRFIMLSRDITERRRVEAELQFKNTLLVTEHESSIDGILVVDGSGSNVLSFNRRFVEMWGIPDEVIESNDDKRVLQTVLNKLVEPEKFLAKVQHLYNHPQQTSEDEIVLRDGRVIDRYAAPMNGPDGRYFGRVWYFRDITERKQAEEREDRLYHVLDNTLDMIFIFHPETLRFAYMNKGATDSIGYSTEEWLQMSPPDIYPQMTETEFRKFIAPLVIDPNRLLRFETIHRCKNGIDLPVEVQLQLVQETSGDKMFVAIVRDITERRQAEKELQRQRAFMLQVIDTDPNRILVKDNKGNILLANWSMAAAHGMTPGELVGKNLSDINLSPEAKAVYLKGDRKVIEDGREISQIDPVILPNGKQGWLLTEKKRLTMPNGKLCVLSISVDITQQKLSEVQLAESYKELQRLSLHLENVRADERAKIALNLHDEMGATLAALKMRIAWLASKLPAELPLLKTEATNINELVSGGIHTMHRIVTELRPNLLGDVGLAAAITDYVRKFRQHTNIECFLDLPKDEIVLDANQSHTIFRILQESLNNIAKHAQASRVDIMLAERDESLMMIVKDNGIGFETSTHKEQSFGLLGIRERALMVGGKARISSKPGKGTRVSVSIPEMHNA